MAVLPFSCSNLTSINHEALREAIIALVGTKLLTMRSGPAGSVIAPPQGQAVQGIDVEITLDGTETPEDITNITAIIEGHDPAHPSARQQREITKAQARALLAKSEPEHIRTLAEFGTPESQIRSLAQLVAALVEAVAE